jgi:hypothetical protein
MTTDKNNAAPDLQPAELAEQQGQVIVHALADAYAAGAEGLQFGGLARMEALAAALAATGKQQVGEVQGDSILRAAVAPPRRFDPVAAEAELSALAARPPGAQVPVGYADPHQVNDLQTKILLLREKGESFTMPVFAAPHAHGIGLGQFRRPVEEWRADMERWVEVHGDYDGAFARDIAEGNRLLALIDQRDAAPGVGNG